MPLPAISSALLALQKRIWNGHLPVEIRLAASDSRVYDKADPYYIRVPRLSYLPHLLPRIDVFFKPFLVDPSIARTDIWFDFDGVPLKWHYPIGLLFDLFSGIEPADGTGTRAGHEVTDTRTKADDGSDGPHTGSVLPWKLTVHYSEFPFDQLFQVGEEGKVLLDAYINSVKEADFIRNGSAKTVMSLSKNDSDALWRSVETHDLDLFNSINDKLLNPPGQTTRHIPIKIYLPTTSTPNPAPVDATDSETQLPFPGSVRVVQSLVPPFSPSRQQTTLGSALNDTLPTIFPSRRNPVLATPVLHGVVVPMNAPIEDLGRVASYTDGFLHIVIVLLS